MKKFKGEYPIVPKNASPIYTWISVDRHGEWFLSSTKPVPYEFIGLWGSSDGGEMLHSRLEESVYIKDICPLSTFWHHLKIKETDIQDWENSVAPLCPACRQACDYVDPHAVCQVCGVRFLP